jgi:hypothetical protein
MSKKSPSPPEDVLDLEESEAHGDDDSSGLEPDEQQLEEMRRIFGTTLPQYLQPVEEMVAQILSSTGTKETEDALVATLLSLGEAAGRMGFSEVKASLDRLRLRFESKENKKTPEFREAVLGDLIDLKDIGLEMSGASSAPPEPQGESLLAALRGMKGLDEAALGRLTKAGLVTVEQVRKGRPDEIAVVSGLDLALVHRIRAHLEPAAARESEAPSANLQEQRAELVKISSTCDDMALVLDELREGVKSKGERLRRAQVEAEEWRARCAQASARLEGASLRMRALMEETRATAEQEASFDDEIDGLIRTLGRLRRTVARINGRSRD